MRQLLQILQIIGLSAAVTGLAVAAEAPDGLTVDQAFELLKTYDSGANDKPLRLLELHVVRFASDATRRAQVAERLAKILDEPQVSYPAKVFVCQQLLAVGTEAQVPALAKLLDNEQTAELARFTLDAIPGPASLAAIRSAAERLKGPPLAGAVNSLGLRRDAQAVGLLTKLATGKEPQITACAVEALGKIATAEAAAALVQVQVPAASQAALLNAQLQCAERLAAAGDVRTAVSVYQRVRAAGKPSASLAGLAGLAKYAKELAAPHVLEALVSQDPLVRATGIRLTHELPGPTFTAALVSRLPQVDVAAQAELLRVLGERGDRSAFTAVVQRLDHPEESVRLAAIQALAKLGNASVLARLATLAATAGGAQQPAARLSLVRMAGEDIAPQLLTLAQVGEPAARIEVIRALAARRSGVAAGVLLKAAADANPQVRGAACDALAVLAPPDSYGPLVKLLVAAPTPADAEALELAVLATGTRIEQPAARLGPVVSALPDAPAAVKPSFLRVLSGLGGAEALAAVRPYLHDAEAALRDAAVRAVAKWPDQAAAGELLKIAQAAENATHRTLAIRGYLRLAGEVKDEAARLKLLEQVRPIATTTATKRLLLAVLADAGDPGALHITSSFVDDAEVPAEAAAATLKISRALVRTNAPAVRAALKKILDTTKDKALAEQAEALDEEALRAPTPGAASVGLQPDKKRSETYKAALAKRPPPGFRLACYLDCGPDVSDGAQGGPLLRLIAGQAYVWPDAESVADIRFGTVAFDTQRVVFEATGLNPQKAYQLGFSWWDFDHPTRIQSVWAAGGQPNSGDVKLLDKTALPSGANKQGPETKTLPLPAGTVAGGSVRISFRNESTPNVVVSEVWLWESEAPKPSR